MPYTFSDDCALYFELRGQHGSPLLLIAGYGTPLTAWPAELIDLLAASHRLILMDNRGVGKSGKPHGHYTMSEFAGDAMAVLDAMDIGSAHVMGVSMGGMIAQQIALQYPERVRGLILGCTVAAAFHIDEVTAPETAVLESLFAPRGDSLDDIRKLWPILYSERYIEEERDWLEKQLRERSDYPQSPQYALECQFAAFAETHNVLDRLGEIGLPVLVQTGTVDVLVPPQNSRLIAQRVPDARLVEYDDAGHNFLEEAKTRVAVDILEFLAGVDSMESAGSQS